MKKAQTKESNPTVKEIVSDWLKKNGYDGLYNDEECGCPLKNFMPCCGAVENCVAAYMHADGLMYKYR